MRVVADFVVAHLRGNDFLEDREGAAKAAAFVRSRRGDEFDPLDLGEQIQRLRKERLVQFGGRRVLEPAQAAAAVVQPDAMRKPGPRKRVHLLDVVQEFDQLVRERPLLLHPALTTLISARKSPNWLCSNGAGRGDDQLIGVKIGSRYSRSLSVIHPGLIHWVQRVLSRARPSFVWCRRSRAGLSPLGQV